MRRVAENMVTSAQFEAAKVKAYNAHHRRDILGHTESSLYWR